MKNTPLFLFAIAAINFCSAQSVVVYPSPAQNFNKISDKYLVTIIQNGVRKNSVVYKSTAGTGVAREWGREQNNSFHFTNFSFSGVVLIEITKINSSANSAVIRPTRFGIAAAKTSISASNRKVTFNLTKPAKLSVEFDDDPDNKDAFMIFANMLENSMDVPNAFDNSVLYVKSPSDLGNIPDNKRVVCFKTGIYKIGYWSIPAFIKQVYIAGDAYVIGYLNKDGLQSIKINGRGILSNEGFPFHYPLTNGAADDDNRKWYYPISLKGGQNNVIEGITLIESTAFCVQINANNTLVQNIKINGFRFNNDGITVIGSGNKINDCFLRTNEDAIVPYASNLTISNCVFWQLQGSCIQLGWGAHSMENITISNCDVIHDKAVNPEGNVGFINAMNFSRITKMAIIKNVNVSDIYFDTPILRFLDFRGDRNYRLGNKGAELSVVPWVYKDFHFNNIHFTQKENSPLIYLHGYSDAYPISNFVFENIYLNNAKISSDKINNVFFVNYKRTSGLMIK